MWDGTSSGETPRGRDARRRTARAGPAHPGTGLHVTKGVCWKWTTPTANPVKVQSGALHVFFCFFTVATLSHMVGGRLGMQARRAYAVLRQSRHARTHAHTPAPTTYKPTPASALSLSTLRVRTATTVTLPKSPRAEPVCFLACG